MVEVMRNQEAFDKHEKIFRAGGGQCNSSGGGKGNEEKGKDQNCNAQPAKPASQAKGSRNQKKGGKGPNQSSSGTAKEKIPEQLKLDKVPKALIDARKKEGSCLICAKSHKWRECRSQPVIAATTV